MYKSCWQQNTFHFSVKWPVGYWEYLYNACCIFFLNKLDYAFIIFGLVFLKMLMHLLYLDLIFLKCFHNLPVGCIPMCFQARFWVQVMRDLRNGVKLKKVQERQYNMLPIEFQLTPYEMLMDDIRSKRYTLRKVMVCKTCWNINHIGYCSSSGGLYVAIKILQRW